MNYREEGNVKKQRWRVNSHLQNQALVPGRAARLSLPMKRRTVRNRSPQYVDPRTFARSGFCQPSRLTKRVSHKADLLSEARICSSLEAKNSSSVSDVPKPASLIQPISGRLVARQFSFRPPSTFRACHHTVPLIDWYRASHNTIQSSSINGGLHFSFGIFDASIGEASKASFLSITQACLYVSLLEFAGTLLRASLNYPW